MDFGTRLKQLRKENKVTQTDIAEVLNTTKSTVSRYEGNSIEPNLDTLNKLAEYFDVSIDYLMGKSLVRNSNEKIAFHLNADGLDPEDLVVIQNLIDQMRKKQQKK